MFPATELNLQEAGGPERQCDHPPVREQGDVTVLWGLAETLQEPFLGVEGQFGGRAESGLYPPPSHAPCHPLESSEGGGVEHDKPPPPPPPFYLL